MSRRRRIQHPGGIVTLCFGGLILLGTTLLALPVSHSVDAQVSLNDAFFTSASAVTVTGLAVVDTGNTWSLFGQMVILVLIQVGGLGIMTLAGFFGIVFTRRISIRTSLRAGTEIGLSDLGVLRSLVRNLVVFVAGSEIVIAALLAARFVLSSDYGPARSVYLGVFHAVSAFNNAGFSTFEMGLESYVADWFVNATIAGAFVVGGLGFPVVFEMWRNPRSPTRWSLHTKVTLAMTAALLAIGTVMIAAVEWSNSATLGDQAWPTKILASFFQSATTRTAGFNTVSIGEMRQPTLLLFLLLMVIGASSASTGGGIKTSTFAVVVRATVSQLRGDGATTMFSRRVPLELERQALSLVVAALGAIGTGTFLLTVLSPGIPPMELLFEAASAFGTVGVSTGATADLSFGSRLVVIALMFIGRVGPITFGTAVLMRTETKRYAFAEEQLAIG